MERVALLGPSFVADRAAYDAAMALIADHGSGALHEAVRRAELSRELGNHIHYTRWCRAGRTILMLSESGPHPSARQ